MTLDGFGRLWPALAGFGRLWPVIIVTIFVQQFGRRLYI